MTKTMDEMRCSVVALKPPFDFEENDSQQEMSLTRAMAMSRIHCRIPPIPLKVKSNIKESSSSSTFLRFAQALTKIHEYEAHHETFKDEIWYSVSILHQDGTLWAFSIAFGFPDIYLTRCLLLAVSFLRSSCISQMILGK